MTAEQDRILREVAETLFMEEAYHGVSGLANLPDGTGAQMYVGVRDMAIPMMRQSMQLGTLTWAQSAGVALSRVNASPSNSLQLREELVKATAVLVSWLEHLDARGDDRG